MLLLTKLGQGALDEGYTRAAERRRQGAPAPRHGPVVLGAGLVAIGLLLTTAAAQARDRAPSAAQARTALVSEIERRTEAADRLQTTLATARQTVSRARRQGLRITQEGSRLARNLAVLESATGAGPVTGPGMTVLLTESPAAKEATGTDPRDDGAAAGEAGRVSDRDLQTVVNEVWAAGAEAVAVNEQRLTARSAIRSAGEAVLVDFRPLSPPYTVEAIGPPRMGDQFLDGFGGSYLQVLRNYDIDFAVEESDQIVLPASGGLSLRYATAPTDVPSGTTSDPRERSTR